jgi:hypothetical protein
VARTILGVDFTSAPRGAKPITVAIGELVPGGVRVERIEIAASFAAFDALLVQPGPWVGGFDFPFGLPRPLLRALGWPCEPSAGVGAWARLVRHLEALPRAEMVRAFRGWCDAHPPGNKFAHRATDLRAGSSPSMKWVNPPVAFMLQAGTPRLLAAGVTVPGMHAGDGARVALEAYPGMAARAVVGRASYKSDTRANWNAARAEARSAIVRAITRGAVQGTVVKMSRAVREACVADPRGDTLDAVLCALQAAAAAHRADEGWGLPETIDPVEGWIVGS